MCTVNGKSRLGRWGLNRIAHVPLLLVLAGVLGCDPEGQELLQDIVDNIGDTVVLGEDTAADTQGGAIPTEETPAEAESSADSATVGTEAPDGGGASETAADASFQETAPGICMCECPCDAAAVTDPPLPSDSDAPETTAIANGCLIISEVVEGSAMNKGVELYNCGDESLDLSTYTLCLYTNDATDCGTTFPLSGSVAPGDVATICHTSAEAIPDCDMRSGVTNFSGDDRLALSNTGALVDAFGELLVRPAEALWANITLRRCDPAPYLGDSPFVTEARFTTHDLDDFSDFGLPPAVWSCIP